MRCRKKKNIIENDDRFANYIDWSNIDYALLISFWVFWRALCSASTSTSAIPTNAKPSSAMVTHWRGTRSTLQWCSLFTSSLSFVAIHRVVKVKTNGPLKAAKTITKIREHFISLFGISQWWRIPECLGFVAKIADTLLPYSSEMHRWIDSSDLWKLWKYHFRHEIVK